MSSECKIDSVSVREDKHEITVSCGGNDYTVTEPDFVSLGLSSGSADIEKLTLASEKLSCIKKATSFLAASDISLKKLKEKLSRNFTPEAIEAATELLVRKGYVDDAALASRYAELLTETRMWGKMRISAYLYGKGFSKSDIDTAIDEIAPEVFYDNLARLTASEARGVNLTDGKSRAKLGAKLYRAGYLWSEINHALSEYCEEHGVAEDD